MYKSLFDVRIATQVTSQLSDADIRQQLFIALFADPQITARAVRFVGEFGMIHIDLTVAAGSPELAAQYGEQAVAQAIARTGAVITEVTTAVD